MRSPRCDLSPSAIIRLETLEKGHMGHAVEFTTFLKKKVG